MTETPIEPSAGMETAEKESVAATPSVDQGIEGSVVEKNVEVVVEDPVVDKVESEASGASNEEIEAANVEKVIDTFLKSVEKTSVTPERPESTELVKELRPEDNTQSRIDTKVVDVEFQELLDQADVVVGESSKKRKQKYAPPSRWSKRQKNLETILDDNSPALQSPTKEVTQKKVKPPAGKPHMPPAKDKTAEASTRQEKVKGASAGTPKTWELIKERRLLVEPIKELW